MIIIKYLLESMYICRHYKCSKTNTQHSQIIVSNCIYFTIHIDIGLKIAPNNRFWISYALIVSYTYDDYDEYGEYDDDEYMMNIV